MRRPARSLVPALTVPSVVVADSAVEVDPLPDDEFRGIVAERDVAIDATTKTVIREIADSMDPAPPEFVTAVELLRGDANSASFKFLIPLMTHKNGQVLCARMAKHCDPLVRFLAGAALSGNGNSDAAEAMHALIHDQSISSGDKRLLRTWCDGIGIRVATDDADKILAHLTAVLGKEPWLKKGDVAPEFDTTTISGRRISSRGFKGKIILLHFWSSSCGPCIGRMPSHIARLSKYDADAVEIIYVSLDTDEKAFKAVIDEYQVPFNNVHDPGGWGSDLARTFGVNSKPFDIVIGRNGKVVSNSIDDIDSALNTEAVPQGQF